MTAELATRNADAAMLEKVIVEGDLGKLSPQERLGYYRNVCDSLGLNPLTKPFQYIRLSGKLTLYATKDATEQLARLHKISITLSDFDAYHGVGYVKATATTGDRCTQATGAVAIEGLKGEALANAMMKTETKASRRAVLRLVGLGWLDETEVETIPTASVVEVNEDTGEIVNATPALSEGLAFDYTNQEFGHWLRELSITPDELVAATGVYQATKRNMVAWATDEGINGYEQMKEFIVHRVMRLRDKSQQESEAQPEFLDGVPPNPNLPRKEMNNER